MRKVDGHTHTHYCPHGSGDHVEKMIEKAISLGFTEYHITEHSPIPSSFQTLLQPKEVIAELAMSENVVDDYLREMLAVKQKYADKIAIKVGFEVDFLPTHIDWTKDFLKEYGPFCDTGILSVHFLEGKEKWCCVDYKAEDVKENLVPYYGDNEQFQLAYYQLIEESIFADLGAYKPRKIGHMTLCNKFKDFLGIDENPRVNARIEELLLMVKEQGYILDYNAAGLFKPYCGQTYPPKSIAQKARQLGVQLEYGSDAHSINDIGRGIKEMEELICL